MSRYSELFRAIYQDIAERPLPEDSSFSSFRVLLVDDEPSVLKSLRRVFLDESCEILTAPDARQALLLLEAEPIQLVISDHRMPGMSGAELLQEIKQRWPDILRIMLTGFADIDAVMKVVEEVGVFKFITKPWHDDDLRMTIRLAFKQYQLEHENRQLRQINKQQWGSVKDLSTLLHDNREAQSNLLQKGGLLSEEQLQQVKYEQQENESFLDALQRLNILTEQSIRQAFQTQLNLPLADLDGEPPTVEMIRFLPQELCERGQLLPLKLAGRCLTLAMVDPSDMVLREHIELLTGLQLRPLVTCRSAIEACLERIVPTAPVQKTISSPQIPQLQAGLVAIRQGLDSVEDALQSLSAEQSKCPLCGSDVDQTTAE